MRALAALLILALVWAAGLWAFGERVAASTPAPEPPQSDGIVALTGASTIRLEAAVQLVETGKAKRLLISGVNRQATRGEVKQASHGIGRVWDCCVDLGFEAENTVGNAAETAAWAREHGYRSLIVVTSDYHMPRAILELRAALGDVTLTPYPVVTDTVDARRWWTRPADARRLTVEYCKYLIVLARSMAARLLHGGKSAAPAPAGAPA